MILLHGIAAWTELMVWVFEYLRPHRTLEKELLTDASHAQLQSRCALHRSSLLTVKDRNGIQCQHYVTVIGVNKDSGSLHREPETEVKLSTIRVLVHKIHGLARIFRFNLDDCANYKNVTRAKQNAMYQNLHLSCTKQYVTQPLCLLRAIGRLSFCKSSSSLKQ